MSCAEMLVENNERETNKMGGTALSHDAALF
jgi:hypothetical protein